MDEELREQFLSLMMRCGKMNTMLSSQCGLQLTEMELLHIISGCGPSCFQEGVNLNMQRIQERLQISKPAISYTLNTLEKKAYIVREIDSHDRRRISVTITQEGMTATESSMQQHADMWGRIVEDFGEEDMMQLTSLLTRFFSVMDNICE
ncbi:MAG: MarR family transcriptional regulator [Lachnospiraceae bacterium]|nr:MarR family transcriptional regulator [Lachnospiraceae bacterium]